MHRRPNDPLSMPFNETNSMEAKIALVLKFETFCDKKIILIKSQLNMYVTISYFLVREKVWKFFATFYALQNKIGSTPSVTELPFSCKWYALLSFNWQFNSFFYNVTCLSSSKLLEKLNNDCCSSGNMISLLSFLKLQTTFSSLQIINVTTPQLPILKISLV